MSLRAFSVTIVCLQACKHALTSAKCAVQVKLGKGGVEEVRDLGELNSVEQKGVDELMSVLEGNIKKGVEFAKTPNNEKL